MRFLKPYTRTVSVQFILALFFLATCVVNANDLHSVKFANDDIGYVTGKEGYLAKTTDGGLNWSVLPTGTQDDISDICILGEEVLIIGCSSGRILKTDDGGQSWEEKISGLNGSVKSFFLTYDNVLFAAGNASTLLYSYDHGEKWQYITLDSYLNLNKIFFSDNLNGFIACSNSSILITQDGGLTWTKKVVGPTRLSLNSIHMLNDKTGTVVGDNGYILNTTNGWLTTKKYDPPTGTLNIYDIKYYNSTDGIASGEDFIIKTTNSGREWSYSTIPNLSTGIKLNAISIPSLAKGLIVGTAGTKLVSTDQGQTWNYLETKSGNIKSSLRNNNDNGVEQENIVKLSQNFPNPFNPSTIISYSLPENSYISLKVYDISGREIAVLANEFKKAGSHSANFNASNLSSGIYFYTLITTTNNITSSKTMRMLLIK